MWKWRESKNKIIFIINFINYEKLVHKYTRVLSSANPLSSCLFNKLDGCTK